MGFYTTSSDSGVDAFWGEAVRLQQELNNEPEPDPDFEYEEYQQEKADEARQAMREDGENV